MARKQDKNGVFCTVRADGCARNNCIFHATVKQQFHNRVTVFSTRSVPRCYVYKQDSEEIVELSELVVS
jgi:hypothetical protein